MFERMYVDEPDIWQPVELSEVRYRLNSYFLNVDEVLAELKNNPGQKIRTPWAFFRWVDNS